ncbi:MAG: Co2+/Mg2+ efflux protein ApaG [Deltaproteobacteria bacterium]|nr:Co2+/Mg2+ efflux protein ApaG [Deltaproteobacteria bacterium]
MEIDVETRYLASRSDPSRSFYFYAYQITITNRGQERVQLVARHWIITDAEGRQEEVEGPGVVGETPTLDSGESFTYSSGCPLTTSMGSMRGWYHFIGDEGERFRAEIPPFALTRETLMN